MLSFGVLIAFLITKAIQDWGEVFGIHKQFQNARSISGQGVRIHHRRASGKHIWIKCYRFIWTHSTRMVHIRTVGTHCHLHPAAKSFPPGCAAIYIRLPPLSTQMFTSGILTPDGRGKRFKFPGWTYLNSLIAPYPDGRVAIFHKCCGVLLKLPDICHRHFGIFWDILLQIFVV